MSNPEEKDGILFLRGESFVVDLDGCLTVMDDKKNDRYASKRWRRDQPVPPGNSGSSPW